MSRLILIKHAAPEIVAGVPGREWHLSAGGRQRSAILAAQLAPYEPRAFITSREPKARETGEIVARILNVPFDSRDGLQENDRTGLPFLTPEGLEATIARFFAEPEQVVIGAETALAALARFTGAVGAVSAQFADDTVAIVAHGTVIALFLARVQGIDPFPLWQRLGLPSFVVLARPALTVEALVDTVSPAARSTDT